MKRRAAAAVTIMMAITAAACGSSGGNNASGFSTSLDDACRTMDRDLGKLDPPQSLDDVGKVAGDASKIYGTGVASIKKLKIPTKDASFASDARDLIKNLEDQNGLLDQIKAAARKGDQKTVDTKLTAFNKLNDENTDLADNVQAGRCALDSVFGDLAATPGTTPDTTPGTTPTTTATTVPAATTVPPTTAPATTAPPAQSNKRPTQVADQFTAGADFSFQDADTGLVNQFITFLDQSKVIKPQAGVAGSVEVLNAQKAPFTRVFIFVPDQPLAAGSIEDLLPILEDGQLSVPLTIDGVNGVGYTEGSSHFFVAADSLQGGGVIIWAVANTDADLQQGVTDFLTGLG